MSRLLHAVDTTRFWVVVAIVGSLGVMLYAWSNSRSDVARNAELIASQQKTLAYLCETVRVLDSIYVQTAAIDVQLAADPSLSLRVRELVQQRAETYATAHAELSETRVCIEVE